MALKIEQNRKDLQLVSQRLSCAVETVLMLVRIKAKLGKTEYDKLRQFISPTVDDANETGWEEMTLASVQHLIRLNAASMGQGAAASSQMTVAKIQQLEDVSKLR